jgi:hypothetical protein
MYKMNTGRCVLAAALMLLWSLPIFAASAPPTRPVGLDEARELAYAASPPTKDDKNRLRKPWVEDVGKEPDPRVDFYFFCVHWDLPDDPVDVVNWLAVDVQTGDVWDGDVCREYKSAALTQLKRTIRKRIGLSQQEYWKLKRVGPMCGAY